MREHMGLFRGKRIDNGEWVEGNRFGDELIVPKGQLVYIMPYNRLCTPDVFAYPVDPDTVGECTGLSDKNGKLIFEGDIVEGRDYDEEDGFGVIEWYDGAWEVGNGEWCGTFHSNYNGFEFEIIGNIHDNPEFLKGGEGE